MGFDSYQAVTDQITAALREGTVPWRKPWRATSGGRPMRMSSGTPYTGGINILLLAITAGNRGYTSPWWGTIKEINRRGGKVKEGQNRASGKGSTMVTFWKIDQRRVQDTTTGEWEVKTFPMLRVYNVFNADQCENLPDKYYPAKAAPLPEFVEIDKPQATLDAWLGNLAEVRHNQSDSAHYIPRIDRMELPPREAFKTPAAYYYTAFHESAHSTGHASRLNRPGFTGFDYHGSEKYAKEELVAEIGSAFLLAATGVEEDGRLEMSADYIKGWLTALENDPKLIVQAASAAEKAATMVLAASEPAKDEPAAELAAA